MNAFPDYDEAVERMVVAVRDLTRAGLTDEARLYMNLFYAAMVDGDAPKMRTVLGQAETRRNG